MKPKRFDNSVPYLDIEAVEKNNIMQYADTYSTVLATEGDIFVVWDGSRSGLVAKGMVGAVGSTIMRLTPILVNRDYLYYYLKSYYEIIQNNITGASIPHVNTEFFYNLIVPLPSLEEQKRIVEVLEIKLKEYQKGFDTAKDELGKMSEYRNNILEQAIRGKLTENWRRDNELPFDSEIFIQNRFSYYKSFSESNKYKLPKFKLNVFSEKPDSWLATNIESASIFIIDSVHSTPKFKAKGKFCIDTYSIEPFKINWSKIRKVNDTDFENRISRLRPIGGDVVFSREGTIGTAVVLPENFDICLGQRVMMFRFTRKILPYYAAIYLQSPFFKQFYKKFITGTSSKHLNIKDIRNFLFLVPPVNEQIEIIRQIETQLAKANKIENQYSESIGQNEKLQQSVFQMAFNGQLSSPFPNDESLSSLLERIKKEREKIEYERFNLKNNNRMENNKLKNKHKSGLREVLEQSTEDLTVEEVFDESVYTSIPAFYKELRDIIGIIQISKSDEVPQGIVRIQLKK